MMRNDINIALVAMVKMENGTTENATITSTVGQNDTAEFDWSSKTQSMILGSFYCCYVLAQVGIYSRLHLCDNLI